MKLLHNIDNISAYQQFRFLWKSYSWILYNRCVGLAAKDVKANEDYICRRCIVKDVNSDDVGEV